jgi:AcrR family transcriptional regulator
MRDGDNPTRGHQRRAGGLTRTRVIDAAVAVADAGGITALTIRSLAEHLGVKPMAIYHHVANKDEILDGVVDRVFAEIEQPDLDGDWRAGLVTRSHSVREVLGRHRWAIGLMGSRRNPGPATLRHHDNLIALLRRWGFDLADVAHVAALIDAYVYGFALEEASLPFEGADEVSELAREVLDAMPTDEYPSFVEFAERHVLQPGYDFGAEFAVGLGLVVDAISRLPSAPRRRRSAGARW